MSLCLTMIVKNEAHVIQRCLRSVKPFIDSYSISDTGSTDNTMEIIREELAGLPGVLTSDPWQDFSPNRNLALSRCTGDYVLTIDADEVLMHHGGPLMLDPAYDIFQVKIVYPGMHQWNFRIHRNDPRWQWRGAIHGALYFDGPFQSGRIENISIAAHDDSDQNIRGNKFLRYIEVYEKEPPTPRNVFYHAQALSGVGRNEEALKKFYERAAMGGWEEEVYYSLWKAADLMGSERPFDEIAGALYRAYVYRPSRFEALVKLCQLLRQRKQYYECYRLSLVEPKPSQDILFISTNAPWRIIIEHALAAHYIGKLDESREYFQRVEEIAAQWTSPNHFVDLSLGYYNSDRYLDCIRAAQKALDLKPDYVAAYNNICAAYNALGNFAEGKKAAEEALRIEPNNQLAKNNLAWSIRELK